MNVEEVYYVMEGAGSVQVNNEQAAIRAGDAVPILLNDEQSFVNNTSEDLELLVIGMHLTPEAPTYSMRAHGGLPADAGGV